MRLKILEGDKGENEVEDELDEIEDEGNEVKDGVLADNEGDDVVIKSTTGFLVFKLDYNSWIRVEKIGKKLYISAH